jgi:hypothetical protein
LGAKLERIIVPIENELAPSSGLKNCPTAIEAAGGGLPEIVCMPKFRTSSFIKKSHQWFITFIICFHFPLVKNNGHVIH